MSRITETITTSEEVGCGTKCDICGHEATDEEARGQFMECRKIGYRDERGNYIDICGETDVCSAGCFFMHLKAEVKRCRDDSIDHDMFGIPFDLACQISDAYQMLLNNGGKS